MDGTLKPDASDHSRLLASILDLLDGIDKTETDNPAGWWETSAGAEFGAAKLHQIKALFSSK